MRYFLDIENAVSQPDEHGVIFGDDRLALAQAAATAGEILRDDITAAGGCLKIRVVVDDENRRRVGVVEATLSRDHPT